MTTHTVNSRRTRATTERASLPQRSDFLCRWFSRWVRGYVMKHFHAVRLSSGSRPDVSANSPLIVALNHPSWSDPLIGVILAGLFPERTHFAPMDSTTLARYSLFSKLGFYGIEQGTGRGAMAFLRTTTAVLSQPKSAVWITAQGRFADPRLRPPRLRPGIGHLVERLSHGIVVPLALEYPFWEEPLPEALARFGEPILIEKEHIQSAAAWAARIETNLAAAQDALMADALSRDPAAFETLVPGQFAVGGIFDRWRRSGEWLQSRRFQAEHALKRERH
jgi:1-acyl-sn-glycerol-3-phosphate acyltransferase